MASLAGVQESSNETLSRPTTAQSKGRLVLQVEDFLLANKFVVVTIHEVQSVGFNSLLGTARPHSPSSSSLHQEQKQKTERPEALVTPLGKDDDVEVTGFHISAVDEVENEYSLFISRQKAEYLVRMEQGVVHAAESSSQPQQVMTVEAMANSILMHLDIIGNRHRDIGKLTCREPQAHVAKKERVVPTKSSVNGKQKNAHFVTKRQDQRAARSLQTAVKTREAIASASHKLKATSPTSPVTTPVPLADYDDNSDDEVVSPRTHKARKSSEYRLLSRMAIADNKTIWKSELESIHDDPSFRAMMNGMNGKAFAEQGLQSGDHERIASLSTIKRAVPEKKKKHKELQERRDKGRQARLRITRENSSSAIDIIDNNDPNAATESELMQAATLEEIDGLLGNLVKRLPSLSSRNGSSRHFDLSPSSRSGSRKPSLVQVQQQQQQQEPEQFLRKRSDANEWRVLKTESIFNEIPGMGVEITTERPSRRGSLLLDSPRLDETKRLEKLRMQENARRSSLEIRDQDGNLRRRSMSKAGSKRHSIAKESVESLITSAAALLASSPSVPELPRPEFAPVETERLPSPVGSTAPIVVLASPRTPSLALIEERVSADAESSELFLTTRRFVVEEVGAGTESTASSPSKAHEKIGGPIDTDRQKTVTPVVEPEVKTSRAAGAYALTLKPLLPVEYAGLPAIESVVMTPRSSRLCSEQTIEIHEEESVAEPEGKRPQAQDTSTADAGDDTEASSEFESTGATGDEQAPPDGLMSTLLSPRQACWTDESLGDRSLAASPRSLPRLSIPVCEENTASRPSSQQQNLPMETPGALATDRRARSLDGMKPISSSFRVSDPLTDEELIQTQDEQPNAENLRTQSLKNHEPVSGRARSTELADLEEQTQPWCLVGEAEESSHYKVEEETGVADTKMGNHQRVDADGDQRMENDVLSSAASGEAVDQLVATIPNKEFRQEAVSTHEPVSARVHHTGDEAEVPRQVVRGEDDEEVHDSDEIYHESSIADPKARPEALSEEKAATTIGVQAFSGIPVAAEAESALDHHVELPSKPKQTSEATRKTSATTATSTATSSSPARKTSLNTQAHVKDSSPQAPSKKSRSKGTTGITTSASISTDSTGAKAADSRRKSSLNPQQRALDAEAKDNGISTRASHKSVSKAFIGDLDHHHSRHSHHSPPPDTTNSGHSHEASARVMRHHHESQRRRTSENAVLLQSVSQYHKKYGRWLNGRLIVDKISCLQLEELVLQNPHSEKHLVKLGLRYARWSGTSLAAILLLEHASLNHENAPRTHEYWNSMGNAHLELFLRHRKFLSVSKFHLAKCLMGFTRAFAYMESMANPLLLLRYAICLFWRSGDADLEKADEVFRELLTKFASFCDKDRLNLLFLHFQTLSRLHMYHEAAECLSAVIELHKESAASGFTSSSPSTPPRTPSDSGSGMAPPSPYDTEDYLMMLVHCQQCSGDYILASATFSTILKARGIAQEGSLSDAQYLELWYFLAHKCFAHEEYPLALEFYSIALNFAKDSQVLAAIHYSRGLCLAALGEDAKCVAEYKRARNLNRHVTPLVPLADLRTNYEDEFALLLQKPIRQVIDEVRVNLYDKAVKKLQRLFRRKYHTKSDVGAMAIGKGVLTKTPSSSTDPRVRNGAVGRRSSLARGLSSSISLVEAAAGLRQDGTGGEDNFTESVPTENQHKRFEARQRAAQDKIRQIRSLTRFQTQHQLSSQPYNKRATPTKKVKSMPSEPFALSHKTSGLLSPDWERPELRRKQSMNAFNKLGYIPTTMPYVDYWDQLLSCASDLFESRASLFRAIACIRSALPQATDTIAFCVLAECAGDVSEAIEKLHDPSYEREVAYVCTVIDVAKLLQGFDGIASGGTGSTSGGLLPSTSLSPRLSSEPSCHKMFTNVPASDSPVRFPAIASTPAVADTSNSMTSPGLQAQSSSSGVAAATSPRTLRRVMLPPCITHQDISGTKGQSSTTTGGNGKQYGSGGAIQELSRLGDMVDAHFHERKPQSLVPTAAAMTSPLMKAGTTLHAHSTETIAVLHDFRRANTALLHSQQSFSGER